MATTLLRKMLGSRTVSERQSFPQTQIFWWDKSHNCPTCSGQLLPLETVIAWDGHCSEIKPGTMKCEKVSQTKSYRDCVAKIVQFHAGTDCVCTHLEQNAIGRLTQHWKIPNGKPIYSPHHMSSPNAVEQHILT